MKHHTAEAAAHKGSDVASILALAAKKYAKPTVVLAPALTALAAHPVWPSLAGGAGIAGSLYFKRRRAYEDGLKEYWRGIVDPKGIRDYGIVDGGGIRPEALFEPPYDLVNGSSAPLPGRHALYRATRPIISAALEDFIGNHPQFPASLFAATRRGGWGNATTTDAIKALIAEANIRFTPNLRLRAYDRRTLLALGGIVSNGFVQQVLFKLPRKYHTVASIDGDAVRLDSSAMLTNLRTELRDMNRNGATQRRNQKICYEIWSSKKVAATDIRLRKPVIQPHLIDDNRYIYDGVHLVVARDPACSTGRYDPLIFAAQPLHSLGTVCTDFFCRPGKLLGETEAAKFAEQARKAFKDSGERGFEAVLQVRRKKCGPGESPRIFEGIPGDDCEVTVLVKPTALEL